MTISYFWIFSSGEFNQSCHNIGDMSIVNLVYCTVKLLVYAIRVGYYKRCVTSSLMSMVLIQIIRSIGYISPCCAEPYVTAYCSRILSETLTVKTSFCITAIVGQQ